MMRCFPWNIPKEGKTMWLIKILSLLCSLLILSSCKTFIIGKERFSWNYDDFGVMTEKMCVENRSKHNESSPCDYEDDTISITKIDENTYVFPIEKRFITNQIDDSSLRKEIKNKFNKKLRYNNIEEALLIEGFNWLTDGSVKRNRQERVRKDKEEYIEKSVENLFRVAYRRLNDNPNRSGIGIGIRPVRYLSPHTEDNDSGSGSYGLAEVFFVDMENNNTPVGTTVYGYMDFFTAGREGFNIKVPTCYAKTSKRIDGCVLPTERHVRHWVRQSQKTASGYGTPFFEMSLAKYVPPPKEPMAKGVPIEI